MTQFKPTRAIEWLEKDLPTLCCIVGSQEIQGGLLALYTVGLETIYQGYSNPMFSIKNDAPGLMDAAIWTANPEDHPEAWMFDHTQEVHFSGGWDDCL